MAMRDEIETLHEELTQLRAQLMVARERVRPRLDALVDRARLLREQPGTPTSDPALSDLLERLLTYQRGFEVGDRVRAAGTRRRRRR